MRKSWLVLLLAGCLDAAAPTQDGADDTFVTDGKTDTGGVSEGSPGAVGVLAVVNSSSEDQLRGDVGLSANAAKHIAAHTGTFATLAELDAVPYVGSIAFKKLLAYAKANGLVDDGAPTGGPVPHGIQLDCNTSLGPDQQVTVIGDGTKYTLRELTTSGSQVDRTLSAAEWASHKLNLRGDAFGTKSTLTKEDGSWMLRSAGGGVSEIGNADCWVDKSH